MPNPFGNYDDSYPDLTAQIDPWWQVARPPTSDPFDFSAGMTGWSQGAPAAQTPPPMVGADPRATQGDQGGFYAQIVDNGLVGTVDHDGTMTDVFSPKGSRVRTPVGGTVVQSSTSYFGSVGLTIQGDDGGMWEMRHVTGQVPAGTRVRAGQDVAIIGDDSLPASYGHVDIRRNGQGMMQELQRQGARFQSTGGRTNGPQEVMAGIPGPLGGQSGYGSPGGMFGGGGGYGSPMGQGGMGGPQMGGQGGFPGFPMMPGFGQGFGQGLGQMPQMQPQAQPQLASPNVSSYNKVSTPQTGGTMPSPNTDPRTAGGSAMGQPYQPTIGNRGPSAGGPTGEAGTQFREMMTSDPSNPTLAMKEALRGMGRNPNNPLDLFGKFLLNAAPGLATAFQVDNANALPGSDPVQHAGRAFADFLSGHLATGDIFSTMRNTATRLPEVMQWMRQTGEDGGGAMGTQPYLQQLADTMQASGGQGTLNMLLGLLGPSMSQGTRRGYAEGLQGSLDTAMHNFGENATDPNVDLWTYLLGGAK